MAGRRGARTAIIGAIRQRPYPLSRRLRIKTYPVPEALPYLSPFTSNPARRLYKRLTELGYTVEAEVPFGGGRLAQGGMVADLYIRNLGQNGTVVRVQGEYWHSLAGAEARDDSQSFYLRSRGIRVVDVWTHDIETRLDWVISNLIGQRG